jgi:hypothetical protein
MKIKLEFDWSYWNDLREAFYDESQYVTIRSARGSGKTYNAFQWIISELLTTEASIGLWMDTTQRNIHDYIPLYLEHKILKPIWKYCHINKQQLKLTLPSGSVLKFASAERPELSEGFRYHRMVLNEAGIILKKANVWDFTLEPMTHPRDGMKNKTRLVGTPKGKNKFHLLDSLEDWSHYHFTIYDCPLYSDEEANKIKTGKDEQTWRQEYMAEFLEDAGSVFRNLKPCIGGELTDRPEPGRTYVVGADIAKHQDFTVLTAMDIESGQVVAFDRFNDIDWVLQKQRIYNLAKRFDARVILDSTGNGDSIYDDLVNAGLSATPVHFTHRVKNELIQGLSVAMDNGEIKMPRIDVLLSELEIFGYDTTPSGNIRYNAPEGYHDDCVISLALANKGRTGNIDIPIMDISGI